MWGKLACVSSAGLVAVALSGAQPPGPQRTEPAPPIWKVSKAPQPAPAAPDPPSTLPPLTTPNPDTQRLRAAVEALAREREAANRETRDDSLAAERVRLRAQLLELVKKLGDRRAPPEPAPPSRELVRPAPARPAPAGPPLDTLRQALNLYRGNDIEAALRTFGLIDTASLTREDQAFVDYMIACCLRKQGKLSEAGAKYRDVADAKADAFITECAVWQLGSIRSTQELEAQLEELRGRQKGR